jgi:hypothetical protein
MEDQPTGSQATHQDATADPAPQPAAQATTAGAQLAASTWRGKQFAPRHNWQHIEASYLEFVRHGGSNLREFCRLHQVPYGSAAHKVKLWREKAKLKALRKPRASNRGAATDSQDGSTGQGAGLGLPDSAKVEAAQIIKDALPDAARALVGMLKPDAAGKYDAQATRAALQLLKDLQAEDVGKDAHSSPYAHMTDAELEARAHELWPTLKEARAVLVHGVS